jgi:uncharacterized protein YndB with AHSA1/START domain
MDMNNTEFIALPGRQEVIVTRMIHAPREVVFKTVTDPLLVPRWWGPRRLTTTVHKMTVMPGGMWRFLQRDKEGKEFGFHGVYHDVIIPERLVYTMEYEGMPGHATFIIDDFIDKNGMTIMISKTIFQSIEDRDQMIQWQMEEGSTEITDRLNELLAKDDNQNRKEATMTHQEGNGKSISISRVFNAPRERVWQRWTDPEQYMCWWGPKDFTAPYAKFDLRPGGKYLYCMRGPDGKEYWGTGIYKEIIEKNRLVYTDSFADEYGNVVASSYYGLGSDLPMEMEVELTLEDLDGKTRMTLEHCGIPDGEMAEQTKAGWNESFDKLAECLS